MGDSLDSLLAAHWFTTLDLQSGYWQVPLHPKHRVRTVFSSNREQLFKALPFDLCNIPATFARLMEAELAGLTWETCLVCLDNIIVFGKT